MPGVSLTLLANSTVAFNVMQSYITPVVTTICIIGSLASTLFLVIGGMTYATSAGDATKLMEAKKIIKNALLGLVIVIASATLTNILSQAYASSGSSAVESLPQLAIIEPKTTGVSLTDVLINGVVGLLRNIVESVGEPFLNALGYFINSTPLMGSNSNVFMLWVAVVGITDALFVLVLVLLGLHTMTSSSLGFDEIELKSLLPRAGFVFLLIHSSIFAIDSIINLSNAMIKALQSGFVSTDTWAVLIEITKKSSDLGVAGLLVMIAFLVLVIMLLVYYVGRLISLYIGAILAPLILLLWLLPAFKDFAMTALKTYLTLIFVLFVHAIIILLAASLFTGMLHGASNGQPNTLMALIVGLATVLALLKTQGFMQTLSYAASTPRAAREMASSFNRGVSSLRNTAAAPGNTIRSGYRTAKRLDQKATNYKEKRQGKVIAKRISADRAKNSTPTTTQLRTGETRRAKVNVERIKKS